MVAKTRHYLVFMLIWPLLVGLTACGVKVKEDDARQVMDAIYKARKSGSLSRELKYYAKDDFTIVPFEEVKESMRAVIGRAGALKSVKPLKTQVQKRNQLGKGLVQYLVLSYDVTYENITLHEHYYFYGDSETPKLVYLVLQL